MATIKKARTAQWPLFADFIFNIGADGMLNTAAALTLFNAAGTNAFDVIPLPPGAVVVGGELVVEVADNATGTATMSVGDSLLATRYLAATNIKAAARTALTLTGFRGNGEDIRVTLANADGTATAGVVTLRVGYMINGRANEVNPT